MLCQYTTVPVSQTAIRDLGPEACSSYLGNRVLLVLAHHDRDDEVFHEALLVALPREVGRKKYAHDPQHTKCECGSQG